MISRLLLNYISYENFIINETLSQAFFFPKQRLLMMASINDSGMNSALPVGICLCAAPWRGLV